MKPCERCGRHFISAVGSRLCDPCWEELGQMSFWQDEDETVDADQFEDSDGESRRIDTVFDHEEEARGYQ